MARPEPVTQGVALLGPATPLRAAVVSALDQQTSPATSPPQSHHRNFVVVAPEDRPDTVVLLPAVDPGARRCHGLVDPTTVLEAVPPSPGRLIAVCSTEIYPPRPAHVGLVPESRPVPPRHRQRVAEAWTTYESIVHRVAADRGWQLTVLRAAPSPIEDGDDFFSALLSGRLSLTIWGHDPPLQLLEPGDLAEAIRCAVLYSEGGLYHVAPQGAAPLRTWLRRGGILRLPLPHSLHRLFRGLPALLGWCEGSNRLDYIRYSFTVSSRKAAAELGFDAPSSSPAHCATESQTPCRCQIEGAGPELDTKSPAFIHARGWLDGHDPFGLDERYIDSLANTVWRFLHDAWWRVEVDGLDLIPRDGRLILTGLHRGFAGWDAMMIVHLMATRFGRYPRFLVHPALTKLPFMFDYITKIGGMVACIENADWVLERDQVLGVFPEGVRGAFCTRHQANSLHKFRNDYIRMALRHSAPILPFVTLGGAEIYPIFGQLHWRWWRRWSGWPCLPVAPNFPWLPLPVKLHTRFLEPIDLSADYPPEAGDDEATVRSLSARIQERFQHTLDDMLRRRRSLFFGSIFEESSS